MIDEVMTVTTSEAYEKMRYAATRYGTLVGISSGAALAAAMRVAARDPSKIVVTLFPDTGERYLSML